MPLYSYKCDICGDKFDEIVAISDRNLVWPCEECVNGWAHRDIANETVIMIDDIKPYFDYSLGEKVTGRRDKATKYRNAGMTMVAAPHGGDVTKSEKRLYGDEQYYTEVIQGTPLTDNQKRLDDALEQVEVK